MTKGSVIRVLAVCAFLVTGTKHTLPQSPQQRANSLTVNENGDCPPEQALRSFPNVSQPRVGIGTTATKFPAINLERASQGNTATNVTVNFNASLAVYGYNADKSKVFVRTLMTKESAAEASCGWLPRGTIWLPRNGAFEGRNKTIQPLQMRDISSLEEERRNYLNVKAVVHDLSITGEAAGIDVFEDPTSGQPTDKIRLFDAYLVYDQLRIDPKVPGDETRFWLIGIQPSGGSASFNGWIRQRDVVIWPTRMAVQWNENAAIQGFATPENLAARKDPLVDLQVVASGEEKTQITRRLPVLEQSPPPEKVFEQLPSGGSLAERRNRALGLIRSYRVAAPGQACRRGSNRDTDCLSAKDTDAAREKIVRVQNAALRMDILILIDATSSMEPYFHSTVQALRHFVEQVEKVDAKEFDLRFAISLHGDYRSEFSNPNNVDYREIIPFFRPTRLSVGTSGPLNALLDNPTSLLFGDVHKDRLEAPFAAIIAAAQSSKWRDRKQVPLRFIVHLADDGNRDLGMTSVETQISRYPQEPRSTAASTIRESVDETQVVKTLRDAGVIYIPVSVLGGSRNQSRLSVWNRIFQDQAHSILRSLGKDAPIKEVQATYSQESVETLQGRVMNTVGAILESIFTALNVSNNIDYQACQAGQSSQRCKQLAEKMTKVSPDVVHLVDRVASAAAGLTADEIRNIYSREQSIVTLYAPARARDGKETFTHWVVLDEQEFKSLRSLLQSLCDVMADQDARNPVLKAIREFAELYGHEDLQQLTFGEVMAKRLGIPNVERTDFSGRTSDEIDDAHRAWHSGADPMTWKNWHQRVCRASKFTQLMEDSKKAPIETISCDMDTRECSVHDKDVREFRWKVQVSKGAPVYYAPLDMLP